MSKQNVPYVLISASVDYADEFDCDFFAVWQKADWDQHTKRVANAFQSVSEEIEIYFGTNEFLGVTTYAEWKGNFTTKSISEDDAHLLQRLFNGGKKKNFSFGTGSGYLEDILEHLPAE